MKLSGFFYRNKTIIFVFILLLFMAVVYGKSLNYAFVYLDDDVLILNKIDFISKYENIPKFFTSSVYASEEDFYYRPVLILSFAVDAMLGGINPFFYHLTNLLLHIFAMLLVFTFLKKLKFDELFVFLFTLLFSVHPAFVQAVAWIPGRNDSLLTIFIISALIFLFDYFEKNKEQKYKLVLFMFSYLIARLTKETAVVMTVITPLFMLVFCKGVKKKDWLTILLFVAAAGLMYVFMRNFAMTGKNTLGLTDMVKNVLKGCNYIFNYIEYGLIPVRTYLIGDYRIQLNLTTLFACIIFLIPILASLVFNVGRKQIVLFGLLWFIVFLLPAFARKNWILTHRLYVSYIGMLMIYLEFFTALFARIPVSRKYIVFLYIIIIAVFTLFSNKSVERFENRGVFYANAVAEQSEIHFARHMLAVYYLESHMYKEAEEQMEYAFTLFPSKQYFETLGNIYLLNKKYAQAQEIFEMILKEYPDDKMAMYNLSLILSVSGDTQKASVLAERLIKLYPSDSSFTEHYNKLQKNIK